MLNIFKKVPLEEGVEFKHPNPSMVTALNNIMYVTWIDLAHFELYLEIIILKVLSQKLKIRKIR